MMNRLLELVAWQNSLTAGQELTLWVAASILLYTFSSHLAWRLHDLKDGFLGENIRWLDTWRFRGAAWQLVRFLFYVVVPYGLLVQRRLFSGRALGLVGPGDGAWLGWTPAAWGRGLGQTVVYLALGLLVLGWAWLVVARRLPASSTFVIHRRQSGWELAWDALFLQVHWGFYRAAAGVWLADQTPIWGVLLGLALVGLEALGDPSLFFDGRWPSLASNWVRLALVAWLTSMLFLAVGNLWLAILAHGALTALAGFLSNRISARFSQPAAAQELLLEQKVQPDQHG